MVLKIWHIFKILIILISAWISQAMSQAILHEASMTERHEQWMARYGRQYEDIAEKEKRYEIFKYNAKYIDMINGVGNRPYKLGINEFADLTNDEFLAGYIGLFLKPRTTMLPEVLTSFRYENFSAIPPSIDWRKKGAVTPIRYVGCGAWTIPAVDTVAAITKIKTGKLYTLSVQEILDCINGGNNGCTGGFTDDAFEFIKEHGLTAESNYPSNNNGTCNTKKEAQPVAKISGYENVPAGDENALMKAVANQPVAVYVDASGLGFQFYKSGVFTGDCGTTLDLGVTIIGYGMSQNSNKEKFWVLKNSWGAKWGEKGYMRLARGIAKKGGKCGVAMEATYPFV